jgi:hypothetical protein
VKTFIIAFLFSVLLLSLMSELQEYYATSSSYTDNWEVNNKCCAFSVQYKQWYRAIIVELLPDNHAKVTCIHISSGYPTGSRDSVIGIVTRLRAGWTGVQVPAGARDFLFSKTVQTSSGGHPTSFSMGTGFLSRG